MKKLPLRVLQVFLAMALLQGGLISAQGEGMAQSSGTIQHRLLIVDESRAALRFVDQAHPTKDWDIPFPDRYRDIQLLGADRVLITTKEGYNEYDLKSRQLLKEVKNPAYAGSASIMRTPEGHNILGCNQKGVTFYELDSADQLVRKAAFPQLNTLRTARLSPRGTLLFGANGNTICEADMDGKLLRQFPMEGSKHIYQVNELPNTHLLASLGYLATVAEIDGTGKILKTWGGKEADPSNNFFAGFQLLKNGNVVVCNWTGHAPQDSTKAPQLREYNPEGKLVWQWHDPVRAGSLHGVVVLED